MGVMEMGVIAEGIPRGCHGLFTPVSLGYPLSVFNKNSTLKEKIVFRVALTVKYTPKLSRWRHDPYTVFQTLC